MRRILRAVLALAAVGALIYTAGAPHLSGG
jgi:hypothetical protein